MGLLSHTLDMAISAPTQTQGEFFFLSQSLPFLLYFMWESTNTRQGKDQCHQPHYALTFHSDPFLSGGSPDFKNVNWLSFGLIPHPTMELGPARQTRDKGTGNRVGGSAKRQDARENVGKVAAPQTGDLMVRAALFITLVEATEATLR